MTDIASLEPGIRLFLETMSREWAKHPPFGDLSFPQQRDVSEKVRARWTQDGPEMARIREWFFESGPVSMRARLYLPKDAADTAPVLIYLHGGGFTLFSIDTHDRLMREYAAACGFAVIGLDYPLAPEHKYPVALDCIEAFVSWLQEQGASLGIDTARIAMGGDSAGANLSFATALRLREHGKGDLLSAILSNYGGFSPALSDEAEARFGGPGSIMDRAEAQAYWANYLRGPEDWHDPFACPLVADLHGLPPAFFVIPDQDIITEQSHAMVDLLKRAGGDVSARVYQGAIHSFLEAMSISPLAREAIADGAAFLRKALGVA